MIRQVFLPGFTSILMWLVLSLVVPQAALAEPVLEVIPLKSQLPQNIIPVIKPLIGPDGAVSAMNNQLILKIEPQRLTELRRLIDQLDSPPKRLIIEVSHGKQHRGQGSDYDVSGRLSTSGNSQARVTIRQRRTNSQFDGNQMIRATEGYPAWITQGKIIPYQAYDIQVDGTQVRRQQYTQFQNATSGFYVIPRIAGNRVSLEITQHDNRRRNHDGSLSVQGSSTFVAGQLGEWIELGAINQSGSRQGSGLVHRRSTESLNNHQIAVRVSLAR